MAKSDRLLRLLHAIRVMPAPITAERLAAEIGVSLRSLYRDIDALRAAGAQIEGERGYGYRLIEDPALPPQMFDRDEVEALALALSEIRAWGDPALTRAADSILAKVAAALPDDRARQLMHTIGQIFRPEPRYSEPLDLAPLRAACWQEEEVLICYRDRQGCVSERQIQPLALVYNETCITVLAWCCLRKDFRLFRTDRISKIKPTTISFRPHRVALLRDYVARLQKGRAKRADKILILDQRPNPKADD